MMILYLVNPHPSFQRMQDLDLVMISTSDLWIPVVRLIENHSLQSIGEPLPYPGTLVSLQWIELYRVRLMFHLPVLPGTT